VHSNRHLDRRQEFSEEHIAQTSVPGPAAKPITDLQLGVPSLHHLDGLEQALLPIGLIIFWSANTACEVTRAPAAGTLRCAVFRRGRECRRWGATRRTQ
jgi:GrpB-like predicted nucleotidyltransferase (UPF0157 family)